MSKIKKHDFVEIEYTGKVADGDIVFDTTDEELAKKNNMYQEGARYGPITICIGEQQILKGLDSKLEGKEPGKYTLKLTPEGGFGKKSAKLLKLVPLTIFKKQNVRPVQGLQVNIDGIVGTIRNVAGGRIIVDFNHPLASRDLIYEVKVNRILLKPEEKISSLIELLLNQKPKVEVKEGNAEVTLADELPAELIKELEKKIIELVKVKKVTIKKPKTEDKAEKSQQKTNSKI